jgi:NAD-dependent DNA ligase
LKSSSDSGEKKLQKCIEALSTDIYGVIFKDKPFSTTDETKWETLLNNVGIKTQASTFIEQFKLFINSGWKAFCKKFCVNKEPVQKMDVVEPKSKKCNYNIVFTDIRDNEFKEKLESLGATVSESVTKSTTHLVVKDKNGTTSKMKKAKEYNIPFYTLDEMKKLVSTLN